MAFKSWKNGINLLAPLVCSFLSVFLHLGPFTKCAITDFSLHTATPSIIKLNHMNTHVLNHLLDRAFSCWAGPLPSNPNYLSTGWSGPYARCLSRSPYLCRPEMTDILLGNPPPHYTCCKSFLCFFLILEY